MILKHWIHLSEFKVEFELNFLRREFKVGFEAFNSVQDLVFSNLENNPNVATAKKNDEQNICIPLWALLTIDEVDSMEEIGKSLSFSEVS